VIDNPGLSGKHGTIADFAAAGNTHESSHDYMLADNVVMRDMHEIIDLCAIADTRLAHGSAVDAGIGSDFDIVADYHDTQLRDFVMVIAQPAEAIAIGTDADARVQQTVSTDFTSMQDRNIRAYLGIVANAYLGTDKCTPKYPHPGTYAGSFFDDHIRTYTYFFSQSCG